MTLVEMPGFIARAKDFFSCDELNALEVHIGMRPELVISCGNAGRFADSIRKEREG